MIEATICEIIKNKKMLLQLKAIGRFGEGKWNGPGGKLAPEETPKEGVIREVQEETGLTVMNPKLVGVIDFYFGEKPEPDWMVYIFYVTDFTGEITPNDEGELKWFGLEEIPYDDMWQDDLYWLPELIKGNSFKGTFWYSEDGTELIRHRLNVE